MNIAINGFGRIGRNFLRTVLQDPQALKKMNIVAINVGPAKLNTIAHMFKYDTLMGTYPDPVTLADGELRIGNHRIKTLTALDPATIGWKQYNIDWVVESSGHFTARAGAQKHLQAGAKKVLITAPAKDEDVTIIPGVNDAQYNPSKHTIVSLGSCTTNAFLTMLNVMHRAFIIEHCFMTTVHAYTNTQVLLDVEGEDLRRSRAAAVNIIPTTTGALQMVSKVIPELAGRVEAVAIRVPVTKGSLIDMTFTTKNPVTVASMNAAFTAAADGPMQNILGITMEPLVSSDFHGDSHSVVVDGLLTGTCGNNMGKAFGWYDNEWGYSCRLKSFLMSLAQ